MICNDSYYPPLRPESRLNVKKSNTKRKRKILMSLEKKKDRLLSLARLGGSSRVPSSHQESEGDTLSRAHRGEPRFAFFVSR
jgi:hypothetical protein